MAGRGWAELRGFCQGLSLLGAASGEVTVADGSNLGNPGGGYFPMLGVRDCRWPRARVPSKATSQPDWARSQFSTSDWSHWEVSAGGEAGVMRSEGQGRTEGPGFGQRLGRGILRLGAE